MEDNRLQNQLRKAEYLQLCYRLRFEDDLMLPAFGLMRLRREFNSLLKTGLAAHQLSDEFRFLLRPPLPSDPGLLRRVQQPAPGFILALEQTQEQAYKAGDQLDLVVSFFGQGIFQVDTFSRLLSELGRAGLYRCSGRFSLEAIDSHGGNGAVETLWTSGPYQLTPQIFDLSQLLDSVPETDVIFELVTPARLLRNKRPLFRASFAEVFPFVLRRVTGMLAAWAYLEDVFDVHPLLDCSTEIPEADNHFRWQDWRPLDKKEEAGGLAGSVRLSGENLREIWPVLKIGELFGVGKGAAFGAGRYRLK